MGELHVDDFDYALPAELIAQHPTAERGDARLLDLTLEHEADRTIGDLPSLLEPGDVVVVNDSRVLHARLRGRKQSGGQVEVLVERLTGPCDALAQVRASKPLRPGSRLLLEDAFEVEVGERAGEFYRLHFPDDALTWIERHGQLPLPPYIDRLPEGADEQRYQTVYAREEGSVAAPTAGLHFDKELLAAIRNSGVEVATITLHVGAGTFQPLRVQRVADHRMHAERFVVPPETVRAIEAAREKGGRVLAVGTTSLRALEAAAADGCLAATSGETRLFVTPGFRFRVVDMLLTNFHLPKSTLLMLVSAFGGMVRVRRAYERAIEQRYRFFSYGDAMVLRREEAADAV